MLSSRMNRSFIAQLALATLLCSPGARAQILPLRTYTTADGLLSNRILTAIEDSRGYLWIGTPEGISVFDGVSFTNFTQTEGLAGSYVTSIAESKSMPGAIWVGTLDGGLSKIVRGKVSKVPLDDATHQVLSLVEDRNGVLWCCTNNALLQVRDDVVTRFAPERFARGDLQVVGGYDSLVYILTPSALFSIGSSAPTVREVVLPVGKGASLTAISQDAKGDVWVTTSDSSLVQLRGATVVGHYRLNWGNSALVVRDAGDDLWLGNVYRIAYKRLQSKQFVRYTDANGLPRGNVYPLVADRENTLWFGSWDNGLVHLTSKNIVHFPASIYDSKYAVAAEPWPLAEKQAGGRLWVLTQQDVLEYWRTTDGSWRSAQHRIGPSSKSPLHGSSAVFAHGLLWIACNDRTLRGYALRANHPSQPSSLTLSKTLSLQRDISHAELFNVFPHSPTSLWCVLGSTLVEVSISNNPTIVRRISSPPLPPSAFINAVATDRDGSLWIGDYTLGLFLLRHGSSHPDSVVHFTTSNGLPDNSIRSMLEDKDGRMWIGTRYGGLAIYERGTFTTISTKNGLPSNHIRSMARDSAGTIWLGTSLGPAWNRNGNLYEWERSNALPRNLVNACGVHEEGFEWFATSNGLTLYDILHEAKQVPTRSVPPPTYITRFVVNGESFDVASDVSLSYQQNTCIIGFIGISLRDPDGVRYRYRLTGVDSAWSAPTAQRSVTFAALRPGSYRFEVRAINADGVESAAPATFSFTIHPPFWERLWFIGGVVIVLLTGFAGAVRYISIQRLQRKVQELEKERAVQLERERTRDRIARDLHDDVASTLGSVVIYSESLKRQLEQHGESAELAQRIGSLSQEAQEALGDIVWSTSPTHDTLKDFLTRISDVTVEICSPRGIAYTLTMPSTVANSVLQNDVRKNLLLIFKEAMNNIVKHSGATAIAVTAEIASGGLRITISDNGKGFAVEEHEATSRGHGLRNMHKRAEEIGAQLTIHSVPGAGTSVGVFCRMM
jgi:signal transduction histidine kinase/ligand-binding sensor domain-containing protein